MLSGGSDGIDGNSPAAGAIADAQALIQSQRLGLEILDFQKNNDSTAFFEQVESLVVTGPTGTNVMDLMFVLVL
jgi:hydroxypyruvate reductase/glycerate 2-kinase